MRMHERCCFVENAPPPVRRTATPRWRISIDYPYTHLAKMSRLRPFEATDLFIFNRINLDHFTETYSLGYYLQYLATWPELCYIATTATTCQSMGYLVGKAEGKGKERHGHVTAVTVSPEFRRLGLAKKMMDLLEVASSEIYDVRIVRA